MQWRMNTFLVKHILSTNTCNTVALKTAKSNSTQYPNPENVQNSTVIQNKNQTAFTQGHNDHSSNISPHDCKLCRIILTFKHDLCSAKAKV